MKENAKKNITWANKCHHINQEFTLPFPSLSLDVGQCRPWMEPRLTIGLYVLPSDGDDDPRRARLLRPGPRQLGLHLQQGTQETVRQTFRGGNPRFNGEGEW